MHKQIKIIGAYNIEADLEDKVNEELLKWDFEQVEVDYRMCMNEDEVLYSAMITIKCD